MQPKICWAEWCPTISVSQVSQKCLMSQVGIAFGYLLGMLYFFNKR